MQVTVEKKEGIVCDLGINIPADEIDSEVKKRIAQFSKTAKIDGFRAGKVPIKFIERKYGQQIRYEVINDVLPKKYSEAIKEEKLKAAGVDIEITNDKKGEDLKIVAHVELFPEFEVEDFEKIVVSKPVVKVGEEEVEKMIANLRKQLATWNTVERAAKDEDTVVIDYVGKIDDKTFEGGSATGSSLVLGSKQMILGFEDSIIGMKPKEEKTITATFPEDYQSKDIAGKEATFAITLHEVKEAELPEINEDLTQKLGIKGGIDDFNVEVRKNMDRELKAAVKKQVKEQVFNALKENSDIEIPKSLVKREVEFAKENLLAQMGGDKAKIQLDSLPDDIFKPRAEDRVKLSLILNNIIESKKLVADDDSVNNMIAEMAEVYEDADEVKTYYKNNKQDLENIKGAVIEDKLVDMVLEKAQVSEKETDFFDLIRTAMAPTV